jgi:UMF1 family MFS transporter
MYDFANTIFSMNVLTMYLAQWVVVDKNMEDLWYGATYSASMALVAVTLPVLGALSDARENGRLQFLLLFTLIAVGSTALIGAAAQGFAGKEGVVLALGAFFVANYAFQGSLVFYNALLPAVSTPATVGRVSGFGVALGYVGAIAGLALVAPFVDGRLPLVNWSPPWPEAAGRAAAFYPTAFFYALFSIPLFLRKWGKGNPGISPAPLARDAAMIRPPPAQALGYSACAEARSGPQGSLRRAFTEVIEGIRDTRRYPGVRRFLIANYFFVDAINTVIIFMAVYAQEAMGMPDSVKILFFMVATSGAVVGSLIIGRLSDFWGPKPMLCAVLVGWTAALTAVSLTAARAVFWASGILIGICLGGTWATSRALLVDLTPSASHGRFFGLYALADKAAAVIGPLLWGLIVWAAASLGPIRYRLAVMSLAVMVVIGLIVLKGVPGREKGASSALEPETP